MKMFISKTGVAASLLIVIVLLAIGCRRDIPAQSQKTPVVQASHIPDPNTYRTDKQYVFLRVICPSGVAPINLNDWYVALKVGPNVIVTNNTIPPGSEIQILQINRISNGSPYPPPMPTAAITDLPMTVMIVNR